MSKKAIGIDIGGTGIKGAVVNLKNGSLIGERVRHETPAGGKPLDIAKVVSHLITQLPEAKSDMLVGICFPAIVRNGITMSAANVSKEWIGLDADALFTKVLGRPVHVINDADAAGVAEIKFGAGQDVEGLVMMTTLGLSLIHI
jgi:polyphosphate glucokinase